MAEPTMAGLDEVAIHARAPAYDPATLAELEAVFGHAHLTYLLSLLMAEIGARFQSGNDDRAVLGQDAHALLSSSGSLGFLDLSHRCAAIEAACFSGWDLTEPLCEVRIAARRAIEAIEALIVRY